MCDIAQCIQHFDSVYAFFTTSLIVTPYQIDNKYSLSQNQKRWDNAVIVIAPFALLCPVETIMTLTALIRLLTGVLNQYLKWLRARRAASELQSMPDYILRDIGIQRSSITYVIGHGRNDILLASAQAGDAATDHAAGVGATS
jgi:uncharacterized protein YjiS (DUF1127 family)